MVAPMKRVMRFEKNGKLNPRFVGPFKILERVGALAYRFALPPMFFGVHNVVYISMLHKYVYDLSYVVSYEPFKFYNDLAYEEFPI